MVEQHRVLVVSDTHLSPRTPPAAQSWDAVVALAERAGPDLVVHLGDLTLDGANDPTELRAARAALDRLPAPWLAIPGNHDVGDNPGPRTPDEWVVTGDRLGAWRDTIGADRFATDLGPVRLVGFDTMLAGSGLPAEDEQWQWLDDEFAAAAAGGRPVVLASHKPLDGPADEIGNGSPSRYAHPAGRRRVAAAVGAASVPLVLSGHVHQHRLLDLGGRAHAWAPSTWAVLPDAVQPVLGVKRCGVLELTVDASAVATRVVEPEGMAQHVLGVDIPDPYHH